MIEHKQMTTRDRVFVNAEISFVEGPDPSVVAGPGYFHRNGVRYDLPLFHGRFGTSAKLYVERAGDGFDWFLTTIDASPEGDGLVGEWVLVAWRDDDGEIHLLRQEEEGSNAA